MLQRLLMNRYTCKAVRDMLPLHVGDDLDPRHVDGVDGHLSSCLPCFREFRGLVSMRSRLQVLRDERLPPGVLTGFADEVMARIAVGEPGPAAAAPRPGPGLLVLPRMAAAAALLLVSLAGWRLVSDEGGLASSPRPIDPSLAGLPRVGAAPSLPGLGSGALRGDLAQPAGNPSAVPMPHPFLDPGTASPSSIDLQLIERGGPAVRFLILGGLVPPAGGLQPEEAPRQPRPRDG